MFLCQACYEINEAFENKIPVFTFDPFYPLGKYMFREGYFFSVNDSFPYFNIKTVHANADKRLPAFCVTVTLDSDGLIAALLSSVHTYF